MSQLRVAVHHRKALQVEARARTHRIVVDRPADLGGEDLGMTIGELLLSSLGACTLLTVLSFCKSNGIAIEGGEVQLDAELAEHPKRIGSIHQRLLLKGHIDAPLAERLARVARGCAVHNTLEHAPALHLTVEGTN
jgi:uncharacterized OsmC-like protein